MTDFDVDEFLGGYRPPRLTAKITLRSDLQRDLAALADEAAALNDRIRKDERLNQGPEVEAEVERIESEMQRLVDELNASLKTFEFEALGHWSYKKLQDAHPPLPAEKQEGYLVHMDTFAPALVAASSVAPKLSVLDAEKLRERLTDNQWTKLLNTALAVNIGDDSPPKFEPRSQRVDVQPRSSGTPLSEESLAASSSDGS